MARLWPRLAQIWNFDGFGQRRGAAYAMDFVAVFALFAAKAVEYAAQSGFICTNGRGASHLAHKGARCAILG
jgi:hypothetical protein